MAEARAIKFCTLWDYISSCQRDDKSLTKDAGTRGWTHVILHAQLCT